METLGAFEQLVLFTVLRLGEGAYGVTIRETLEERTGRAGRPPKYYRVEPEGARALLSAYPDLQSVAGGVVSDLAALAEG